MNNTVVSLLCWFDLVIQNHFTLFISWGEYLMFTILFWFFVPLVYNKDFLSFSPSTKYHKCVKFGICLHSQENRQLRKRMFFRDYITICRSIRKLRMMVKPISATINGEFQSFPQLVYCEWLWLSVLGLDKWQKYSKQIENKQQNKTITAAAREVFLSLLLDEIKSIFTKGGK